jgi:predicted nucleic acid-binding protein
VASFVLDASAALACCFEDEATPFSDRLTAQMEAGEEAIVPSHWPVEFLSALQQGRRRKRIDEAGLLDSLRFFASFRISIEPPIPVTALPSLRALCRKHDLSAYDAAYLGIAMRLMLPLATIDGRLIAASTLEGVALIA